MPGTFLTIWNKNDMIVRVRPECVHAVDAAVSAYIDSGGTRDSIIHVTHVCGYEIGMLASTVASWCVSTNEDRRSETFHTVAIEEEEKRFRKDAGVWEQP